MWWEGQDWQLPGPSCDFSEQRKWKRVKIYGESRVWLTLVLVLTSYSWWRALYDGPEPFFIHMSHSYSLLCEWYHPSYQKNNNNQASDFCPLLEDVHFFPLYKKIRVNDVFHFTPISKLVIGFQFWPIIFFIYFCLSIWSFHLLSLVKYLSHLTILHVTLYQKMTRGQ